MSMAKLEKGVPLPVRAARRRKYPWEEMAVGDSFVVPIHARYGLSSTAKRLGIRITTRKIDDNTARVWRIA